MALSLTLKKGKVITFIYDLQEFTGELDLNKLSIIAKTSVNVFPLEDIESISLIKERMRGEQGIQHMLQIKTDTGGWHKYKFSQTEENEYAANRLVRDIRVHFNLRQN